MSTTWIVNQPPPGWLDREPSGSSLYAKHSPGVTLHVEKCLGGLWLYYVNSNGFFGPGGYYASCDRAKAAVIQLADTNEKPPAPA